MISTLQKYFGMRFLTTLVAVLLGVFALIILLGILTHLQISFRPATLFDTLIMLGLLAGGVGLVARSLRAYEAPAPSPTDQGSRPI